MATMMQNELAAPGRFQFYENGPMGLCRLEQNILAVIERSLQEEVQQYLLQWTVFIKNNNYLPVGLVVGRAAV